MKKIISILTAIVAVVLLASCNKSSGYPSHLEGYWFYTNSSTGYTGTLCVEDIAGGQYAYFYLITPTKAVDLYSEGSFSYDEATGIGTISNSTTGGKTVKVQAVGNSGSILEVSVTQVVSGGPQETGIGTFNAATKVAFMTGKWTGQVSIEGGLNVDVELEITSLETGTTKCGTMTIAAAGTSVSADVASITPNFVSVSSQYAYGSMIVKNGTSADVVVIELNRLTNDVKLLDPLGYDTIALKKVK